MIVRRLVTAVAALVGVGIIAIGTQFLFTPEVAAAGFGVAGTDSFLAVKGVRDIGSGLVLLAVVATAPPRAVGWVLLAAAVMPLGDAGIVLADGGPTAVALGVHGATALVMAVAGVALLRSERTRPPADRRLVTA